MNSQGTRTSTARRPRAYSIFKIGVTLSIVCVVCAVVPERSGVRIPVTCANGEMGYINTRGLMVIAPIWQTARCFDADGTAEVQRSKRQYHFGRLNRLPFIRISKTEIRETLRIDRSGNVVDRSPAPQRTSVRNARDPDEFGMTMIRENNTVRWVKEDGSLAFPGSWENGADFHGYDPAAVRRNGRWGFINRKGEMITGYDWVNIYGFDGSGRAVVSTSNSSGCIDREGKFLTPLRPVSLGPFDSQGTSICRLGTRVGVVDWQGKIVIPFRYDELMPFDHFNMARAVIRTGIDRRISRVGWIDRSGNPVIPLIYRDPPPGFSGNFKDHQLLPIRTSKGSTLIDRNGKITVPAGNYYYDHMQDPIAPNQFWIYRKTSEYGSSYPISPQCYDQHGTLIWQGSTLTRMGVFSGASAFFALLSLIAFSIARTSASNCRRIDGTNADHLPG